MGETAAKTSDAIVSGTKSAVNVTVDTTTKVAHSVADTTKNVTAAGLEKTGEAWQGIEMRPKTKKNIRLNAQ